MPRRQWTEEQQVALNQRRALFATRYQHITLNKRHRVNRTACPCCGYPTLSERGRYEICGLCFWEDDGQDDDDADTCWGGPNGDYSLTEARLNVLLHDSMYHPDNNTTVTGPDTAEINAIKQTLRDLYTQLPAQADADLPAAWKTILEQERTLRKARDKRWKALQAPS
ncbi:MAG: CPCC family cysteine-rich protein [Pseudomonadota bacterium]|nr:CPCC family cysteine-rich protein [Pseudomonadota bacterium]